MKNFNKEFIKDFPKSYSFLACIGWLPYFALPLTILTERYKEGVPEELFNKIVFYSTAYEYLFPAAFLLAFIVVFIKAGEENKEKGAKSYKKRY